MCGNAHAHAPRVEAGGPALSPSAYPLETRSLTKPRACHFGGRLDGHRALVNLLFLPTYRNSARATGIHRVTPGFCMDAGGGAELRSPCLHSKQSYPRGTSPQFPRGLGLGCLLMCSVCENANQEALFASQIPSAQSCNQRAVYPEQF